MNDYLFIFLAVYACACAFYWNYLYRAAHRDIKILEDERHELILKVWRIQKQIEITRKTDKPVNSFFINLEENRN